MAHTDTQPGPAPHAPPTPEVVELQRRVVVLEEKLKRAIRSSTESEIARQTAEAQLECKLFILDGSNDELAQDLEKRLIDLSTRLEEARKREDEANNTNGMLKQEIVTLKDQLNSVSGAEKEYELEINKWTLEKAALIIELGDMKSKLFQTESSLKNELKDARQMAEDALSNDDELTRENYLLREEIAETKRNAEETSRKMIDLERKNYAQILEIAQLRTLIASPSQELIEIRQKLREWEGMVERAHQATREAEIRAARAMNLLDSNQGIYDAAKVENDSLKLLLGVYQQKLPNLSSLLDEDPSREYDGFGQNRISTQNFTELIRVKDALEMEVADLKRTIAFAANANQQLQERVNFLSSQLEAERWRANEEYDGGGVADVIGADHMAKLLAEYEVWRQQRQPAAAAAPTPHHEVKPAASVAAADSCSNTSTAEHSSSEAPVTKIKMELEEGEIED